MTEDSLLKLLDMFARKVRRTQSKYPVAVWGDEDEWNRSATNAFKEVKELVESMHNSPVCCQGPFSEELPEDHTEIGWGWRVYGCENHAHIIHLKYGYIVVNKELAEKILVLGIP